MLIKLILLLTVIPVTELMVLLHIARVTGVPFTILLIIGTGVIGGILAKIEGLRVFKELQQELQRGKLPAQSLMDAVMVFMAGAMLLTPGVITDTLGFMLLIPFFRKMICNYLKYKFKNMVASGNVRMYKDAGFGPINNTPPPGSPPIEDNADHSEDKNR